jgi:hypothetical protein
MPPLTLEPVIVEPKDLAQRKARPEHGEFLLYDGDFPLETDPKYVVEPPSLPLRVPHYPASQVADWVFGQTTDWIKNQLKGKPYRLASGQLRITPLTLGGQELEFRIIPRGRTGERRFTLPDIERLAWALYERNDIDGKQLQGATQIIMAVANQHWSRMEQED